MNHRPLLVGLSSLLASPASHFGDSVYPLIVGLVGSEESLYQLIVTKVVGVGPGCIKLYRISGTRLIIQWPRWLPRTV